MNHMRAIEETLGVRFRLARGLRELRCRIYRGDDKIGTLGIEGKSLFAFSEGGVCLSDGWGDEVMEPAAKSAAEAMAAALRRFINNTAGVDDGLHAYDVQIMDGRKALADWDAAKRR